MAFSILKLRTYLYTIYLIWKLISWVLYIQIKPAIIFIRNCSLDSARQATKRRLPSSERRISIHMALRGLIWLWRKMIEVLFLHYKAQSDHRRTQRLNPAFSDFLLSTVVIVQEV